MTACLERIVASLHKTNATQTQTEVPGVLHEVLLDREG
jgi:hypothetical protein